jgi:hypothetical protein
MSVRPSFIFGVTGQMDLEQLTTQDLQSIREAVKSVFRFVTKAEAVDPLGSGLGLARTPVTVLTSLAPGADQLVAEVAESFSCQVVAPLPFPPQQYLKASTFKDYPEQSKMAADWLAKLGDRAFFVPLLEEVDCSPEELDRKVRADLGDPNRRRLRYRAAGEYVAAHCHVLIALTNAEVHAAPPSALDPGMVLPRAVREGRVDPSSEAIVRVKREGTTPCLLPTNPGLTWTDTGPVIHIYTPRPALKVNPATMRRPGDITVLFPADYRRHEDTASPGEEETDQERSRRAGELLRATAKPLERFNRETDDRTDDREPQEFFKLLGLPVPSVLSPPLGFDPSCYTALDRLARVRRRAADWATHLDRKTLRLLRWLFLLTFAAALLLHFAAHWHPRHAAPGHEVVLAEEARHDAPDWLRAGCQTVALLLVAWGLARFYRFKYYQVETARYDDRALAEGLRVQFYWAVGGLRHAVLVNYVQRQHNEMDWIRKAVNSLAAPYHRWPQWFRQAPLPHQVARLRAVADGWLAVQQRYYESTYKKHHHSLHRWHQRGVILALAGVLQAALLLGWYLMPGWFVVVAFWCCLGLNIAALTAFCFAWAYCSWKECKNLQKTERASASLVAVWRQHRRAVNRAVLRWLINTLSYFRKKTWWRYVEDSAIAVLATATVSWLCVLLAAQGDWMPEAAALWIIVMDWFLVAGALAVAWAEKNLWAEQSRQYNAMDSLFAAALRRVDAHLKVAANAVEEAERARRPVAAPAAATDSSRTADDWEAVVRESLAVVQELFYQVGLQALDEHAEWLMLHRARPLEPVMAG